MFAMQSPPKKMRKPTCNTLRLAKKLSIATVAQSATCGMPSRGMPSLAIILLEVSFAHKLDICVRVVVFVMLFQSLGEALIGLHFIFHVCAASVCYLVGPPYLLWGASWIIVSFFVMSKVVCWNLSGSSDPFSFPVFARPHSLNGVLGICWCAVGHHGAWESLQWSMYVRSFIIGPILFQFADFTFLKLHLDGGLVFCWCFSLLSCLFQHLSLAIDSWGSQRYISWACIRNGPFLFGAHVGEKVLQQVCLIGTRDRILERVRKGNWRNGKSHACLVPACTMWSQYCSE